jgi:uncharacterized protein YjbJ (UPF0337 family)
MSDTYSPRLNPAPTDLAEKAKDMVRDVKEKAVGLTGDVTRAAKDNAVQLGNTAREFADTSKEKVGEAVNERKSIGAEYLGSIAQATGQAAEAFESNLPQAARYIRQASDQIQGVADKVRDSDVRELVGEVQDFARKQPTLFFGGAVILGFAALRFLKSTPPENSAAFDARREG